MTQIPSPAGLAETLTKLFPQFAAELDEEDLTSYHLIIQSLAPVVTGYLERAPTSTLERFCELVNALVAEGGERANAISTCLLEHASQLKLRKLIRPYLSAVARQELR